MPVKKIPNNFFNRKTLRVTPELLGKFLVRKYYSPSHKRYVVAREKITEVEAYVGPHDLACHSSRGKTARTKVMYSPAGTIYIYLIYGTHWMLNIVTEKENFPAAILIRATQNFKSPGVLTRELKIDKSLNGLELGKKAGLWIESEANEANKLKPKKLVRTPRIGVSYAGPIWSAKPYRFLLRE